MAAQYRHAIKLERALGPIVAALALMAASACARPVGQPPAPLNSTGNSRSLSWWISGANHDGWKTGRATHYGGPEDWWNIHEGSCGYGFLDSDKASGWDIAAMSDSCEDYSGSCGRCYEIKCDPTAFKDGYGETLDRTGVCYDPDASLVVQVTDSCPCNYPGNAYSNKRWCCGDMYHLDISTYAFEKLADKKWGVIGLKVRRVECNTRPWRQAPAPSSPSGPNLRIPRPWGWFDRRPWF